MKREILIKTSFVGMIFFSFLGSIFKIVHDPAADTYLLFAMITMAMFIGMCIYEVNSSRKIDRSEKLMWTVGIIFIGPIAGFFYLLSGRKKIVAKKRRRW